MLKVKERLREPIKWIITGTGRCGTVYMARVLTSLGVPCGHESIFTTEPKNIVFERLMGYKPTTQSEASANFGWLKSDLVADSSFMAMPYLQDERITHIPVYHIVRNPFAVISSFVLDRFYFSHRAGNPFNRGQWEQWMYSNLPNLAEVPDHPLAIACYYWTYWNEKIEEVKGTRPYLFHKIEDDLDEDFFDFFKIRKTNDYFKNKRINSTKSKRSKDIKLSDIPDCAAKNKFVEVMSKYGYT